MSSPTLKEVILKQHRKADGSYAVKIRLTHNRAVKYLPTNETARPGDYDKDLNITSRAMLKRLLDVMDEIDEIIGKKNSTDTINASTIRKGIIPLKTRSIGIRDVPDTT